MIDDGKPSTREEQAPRLAESLKRQLRAFCPLLMERDLVELTVNAEGRLGLDRLGRSMTPLGRVTAATAESFTVAVLSTRRGTVTPKVRIFEYQPPPGDAPFDGSKFEALIPPVVSGPAFTICRKACAAFTPAVDERQRIMTVSRRAAIKTSAVQCVIKSNVPRRAVSGKSGTAAAVLYRARFALNWCVFLSQSRLPLLSSAADRLRANPLGALVRRGVRLRVGVGVEVADHRLQFDGSLTEFERPSLSPIIR